jgi:hypothetical protein
MYSRPVVLCALAAAAFGLVATPVGAKEGVVARVLTPISRDVDPGTRITVVWTLSFVEAGERRPFGAGGVFVRLFGRDGSRSRRAYASESVLGRYRATVRVPRGGVRRIEIGLMGTVCDSKGCRPAPKIFPIDGSPLR